MRDIRLLSNRVKKNPSTDVDPGRYEFLNLENAEPDFGIPTEDNGVPASDVQGNRKWLVWDDGIVIESDDKISVDATVLRTFGDQSIDGLKTFNDQLEIKNDLSVTGTILDATWQAKVIDTQYGGTGQSSYDNGEILVGNSVGNTLTKTYLTDGRNITITNAPGSITIQAADTNLFLGISNTDELRIDSSTGNNVVIPIASNTQAGIITANQQVIYGQKTFNNQLVADNTLRVNDTANFQGIANFNSNVNISGTADISLLTVTTNATVSGSLIVEGNDSLLFTNRLQISDNNIEIGKQNDSTVESNDTADAGGITLLAGLDGDKTLTWSKTSESWTSSEHFNLAENKEYRINESKVIGATSLGSVITDSSLNSVATLTSGTWEADIIQPQYGGTGVNNGTSTITIASDLSVTGGNPLSIEVTDVSSVTMPLSGTLATLAETETFTNKTINADNNNIINLADANFSATANIANDKLENSSITLGTTEIELGDTFSTLDGIIINATAVSVDNISIDGNTISSTNTDGNIVLDPNGEGNISASFSRIIALEDPIASSDAATKAYVDGVAQGIITRPAAKVATTQSLDAVFSAANGTLTIEADGSTTDLEIDGVILDSIGDEVLVKDQINQEENGIYILTSIGSQTSDWVLERCDFCNESQEIPGSFVFVTQGIVNASTGYILTVEDRETFTLNVDPIIVVQFSGAGTFEAGQGLTLTGNVFSVNENLSHVTGLGTITSGTWQSDLGTITVGIWNASTIGTAYGGTGLTSYNAGELLIGNSSGTLTRNTLTQSTGIAITSNSGSISIENTDLGSSQEIFKNIANASGIVQFSAGSNNDTVRFEGGDALNLTFDDITNKVKFDHANTSSQSSSDNNNGSVIQDIFLDQFGHVTSIGVTDLDNRYFTESEATAKFVDVTGDTMTGFLTLSDQPVQADHAATKQYVDLAIDGYLQSGPEVKVATTQNLDATYNNGSSGIGATLTATNASEILDVDGKTDWQIGDGILVKDQTNQEENGRYDVSIIGDSVTAWVLTRSESSDEADELSGQYVFVVGGNTNEATGFVADIGFAEDFVFGTDPITYNQFSGIGTLTAGDGIEISGTEFRHADTSTVANLASTDKFFVDSLSFDDFGHVTNYSVAEETYVSAISFDSSTGILTLTRNDAVSLTDSLDGRYLLNTATTDDVSEGTNNKYYTDQRVETVIQDTVDKTFVDNLNVDADTLDGEEGSYYLDWNNTTNKPSILPELIEITKSITVSSTWIDTGIKNNDIETGTYVIQLFANDLASGGANSNEYYSGTMSWYAGATNDAGTEVTDEIVLHRAGGSATPTLFLRTLRSPSSDVDDLKLQIYSTVDNSSASDYVFKFKKII
jgi:hypothetical protein